MNPQDLVGKTEICSECGKQKKIGLVLDQAPNKQGIEHSPYLKCEDCVSQDLEKDENK
jgi:DNA-directed RNA polymerase subunit RPC12/RpoP